MRINEDKTTYKPPYTVVLLDAMDAYYYADVMDKMEEVAKEEDLGKAIALADALFVTKNHGWESLKAMNELDAGYDVRVYDSTSSCVYAAHTKYIENWIGKTPTAMMHVDPEKAQEEFDTMLKSVVKDFPGAIVLTTKKYHRTLLATGEADIRDDTKPFRVLCDDMFHYQDSDARLFIGAFATREEAVDKCQAILMETLFNLYEPGMTEEALMTKWWSFGDDPWVSGPNHNPDDLPFSADEAAPAFAKFIIEQKEKELTDSN